MSSRALMAMGTMRPRSETATKAPSKARGKRSRKKLAFHPFSVLNAFRDSGAGSLAATERLVWIIIWSHTDSQTGPISDFLSSSRGQMRDQPSLVETCRRHAR